MKHKKFAKTSARALRRRGKCDARKGEPVVSSTITSMIATQSAAEYQLAQETEDRLHPVRINAAKAMASRHGSNKQIRELPAPIAGSTAADIRANRHRAEQISTAKSNAQASTGNLVEMHEQILRENCLLLNEIHRTRQLTTARIEAYISGVHCSKNLPTYDYGEFFDGNPAYDLYCRQHQELDEAIHQAAQQARINQNNRNNQNNLNMEVA